MQRLHGSRGNHDSASRMSTDTLRSSDFSGAITRPGSLRVPPEVTFVAGPSGAWGPNDEEVDKMRCDSTHSHLSREQLSKLPNSNSVLILGLMR